MHAVVDRPESVLARTFALSVRVLLMAVCSSCDAESSANYRTPETAESTARLERATALIQAGKSTEARRLLESLGGTSATPTSGRVAFYLGMTYHKEKRYARAADLFTAALRDEESFQEAAQVHHYHGWSLFHLGRLEEAQAAFERHLVAQPDAGDSHYALGLVFSDRGETSAAKDSFRRAIALEDADPSRKLQAAKAYTRLSDLYAQEERWSETRALLLQATRRAPRNPVAYYKLYRVLTRLGEADSAARALRQYELWKAKTETVER